MAFSDELAALGVQGRTDLLNTLSEMPRAEMNVAVEAPATEGITVNQEMNVQIEATNVNMDADMSMEMDLEI